MGTSLSTTVEPDPQNGFSTSPAGAFRRSLQQPPSAGVRVAYTSVRKLQNHPAVARPPTDTDARSGNESLRGAHLAHPRSLHQILPRAGSAGSWPGFPLAEHSLDVRCVLEHEWLQRVALELRPIDRVAALVTEAAARHACRCRRAIQPPCLVIEMG
eukprot:4556483-Prymnesium_polylepis.1